MTDLKTVERFTQEIVGSLTDLKQEIKKAIVGQEEIIDQLLITFLAGGHALLEGVPGLAKTLMIRSLSEAIDLRFRRIQFTPDLMPSDIIGTEILEEDHTTAKGFLNSTRGRFSRTLFWRTRSTARHQKHKQHCSKRCRNSP